LLFLAGDGKIYGMLSRKHFQALADCAAEIIANLETCSEWDKRLVIREIASVCKSSNPNFDSQRFEAWVNKSGNALTKI